MGEKGRRVRARSLRHYRSLLPAAAGPESTRLSNSIGSIDDGPSILLWGPQHIDAIEAMYLWRGVGGVGVPNVNSEGRS